MRVWRRCGGHPLAFGSRGHSDAGLGAGDVVRQWPCRRHPPVSCRPWRACWPADPLPRPLVAGLRQEAGRASGSIATAGMAREDCPLRSLCGGAFHGRVGHRHGRSDRCRPRHIWRRGAAAFQQRASLYGPQPCEQAALFPGPRPCRRRALAPLRQARRPYRTHAVRRRATIPPAWPACPGRSGAAQGSWPCRLRPQS